MRRASDEPACRRQGTCFCDRRRYRGLATIRATTHEKTTQTTVSVFVIHARRLQRLTIAQQNPPITTQLKTSSLVSCHRSSQGWMSNVPPDSLIVLFA